jgi:hypothetical protein
METGGTTWEIVGQNKLKSLGNQQDKLAMSWAIEGETDKTRMSEKDVPKQYKDYSDVFSEEKAKRFPPAREEDHQIKFTKNVPKYFKGDVYSLTTDQTTFLRKWLDKELNKGFIRPSKSPYSCPSFLIEKKMATIA